jgi:hypothetical protein
MNVKCLNVKRGENTEIPGEIARDSMEQEFQWARIRQETVVPGAGCSMLDAGVPPPFCKGRSEGIFLSRLSTNRDRGEGSKCSQLARSLRSISLVAQRLYSANGESGREIYLSFF